MASDPIDFTTLDALSEMLGERFSELIATFVSDSANQLAVLRQSLTGGEMESAMRAAHSLKGSCRNMGAGPLSQLCETLENQIKDGSPALQTCQLDDVEAHLLQVNGALASYLNASPPN